MIWLTPIRKKFRSRAAEWYLATLMFGWGMTLMYPAPTYDSPFYVFFAEHHLREPLLGGVVAGIGLIWLVGLTVNGRAEAATSTLRASCAFIGSVVFGLLSIAFLLAFLATGIPSVNIWMLAMASALALWSLYRIMQDKRSGA